MCELNRRLSSIPTAQVQRRRERIRPLLPASYAIKRANLSTGHSYRARITSQNQINTNPIIETPTANKKPGRTVLSVRVCSAFDGRHPNTRIKIPLRARMANARVFIVGTTATSLGRKRMMPKLPFADHYRLALKGCNVDVPKHSIVVVRRSRSNS